MAEFWSVFPFVKLRNKVFILMRSYHPSVCVKNGCEGVKSFVGESFWEREPMNFEHSVRSCNKHLKFARYQFETLSYVSRPLSSPDYKSQQKNTVGLGRRLGRFKFALLSSLQDSVPLVSGNLRRKPRIAQASDICTVGGFDIESLSPSFLLSSSFHPKITSSSLLYYIRCTTCALLRFSSRACLRARNT